MTAKQRAARWAGEFPPAPEPLAVPVVDSHTHLDITVAETEGDAGPEVGGLIARAAGAGVDRLVQVGVDVESSRGAPTSPTSTRKSSRPSPCARHVGAR